MKFENPKTDDIKNASKHAEVLIKVAELMGEKDCDRQLIRTTITSEIIMKKQIEKHLTKQEEKIVELETKIKNLTCIKSKK